MNKEIPKEIVLVILRNISDASTFVSFCKIRKDWRVWIKDEITCFGRNGQHNYKKWRDWFSRFSKFLKIAWVLPDTIPHGPTYRTIMGDVIKKTYYRGVLIEHLIISNGREYTVYHLYV